MKAHLPFFFRARWILLCNLIVVSCSKGFVNFLNDRASVQTSERLEQLRWTGNIPLFVSGAGAGTLLSLSWQATGDGSYETRLNGDCTTGTTPSDVTAAGTMTANTGKLVKVHSSELALGDNTVNICAAISGESAPKIISVVIHRDDTPPVSTATPGVGDYASTQTVTISCTDNCLRTVYTTDGSVPSVAADGTILNGSLYTGPLTLPDPVSRTLRYISVDKAGNIEASAGGGLYRIDSGNISLAIISAATYNLSTNGYASSVIQWSSNRPGVAYDIRLNAADCSSTTPIASGTAAASNNFTLSAAALSAGANNLRICSSNYLGVSGSVSAIFNQQNTVPTTSHGLAGGSYTTAQTATLSCNTSCSIAYTTDGTTPTVDATGTITNGSLYVTGGFTLPDQTTTTVKYFGFDAFGNRESNVHAVTYNIDTITATVNLTSVATYKLSANGFTSSAIQWTTNRVGTAYSIRINSTDCTNGGVLTSGTSAATNNYTLNAASLNAGANNIRMCSANLAGIWGDTSATFTRQDTLPTTSDSPGAGNFNTIPTITLSCTATCTIAYTTDGSNPAFNASGTITNGNLYAAAGFTVPDQTTTVVKYIGFDEYGNREASWHSASYNVDSTVPSVAITCLSHNGGPCLGAGDAGLGAGGATVFKNIDFTWTSSRTGLYYEIRVGGSNCNPVPSPPCTIGSLISGGGGYCQRNGTSAASQTITLTYNDFPWAGSANDARVCVFNLLGNPGASANTNIARWDAGPTLAFVTAPGSYSGSVSVQISCTNFGGCSKIYYTDTGVAPVTTEVANTSIGFTSGTMYSGAISITVPGTYTIKAKGHDVSGNWSNDLSGTFTVTP